MKFTNSSLALVQIRTKWRKAKVTLNNKKLAIGAFLDTSGEFNNTTRVSTRDALGRREENG